MEIIKIRGKNVITEEGEISLENIGVDIVDGVLVGLFRASYLIQILREHEKLPSKFSIAKKLDNLKKSREQKLLS
jgi:hypothetical protein